MYKTLIAEIGRLVKSALPYAIADANPKNWFCAITSYRSIQAAVDAGHNNIQVKPGVYGPVTILAAQTGILIQGQGRYSGCIIDGGGTANGITINASYTIVRDMEIRTPPGVASYNSVHIGNASDNPAHIDIISWADSTGKCNW